MSRDKLKPGEGNCVVLPPGVDYKIVDYPGIGPTTIHKDSFAAAALDAVRALAEEHRRVHERIYLGEFPERMPDYGVPMPVKRLHGIDAKLIINGEEFEITKVNICDSFRGDREVEVQGVSRRGYTTYDNRAQQRAGEYLQWLKAVPQQQPLADMAGERAARVVVRTRAVKEMVAGERVDGGEGLIIVQRRFSGKWALMDARGIGEKPLNVDLVFVRAVEDDWDALLTAFEINGCAAVRDMVDGPIERQVNPWGDWAAGRSVVVDPAVDWEKGK